ncbi:rhamnogalacturonan acetylesterase [Massilia sp. S19_KUP03_FR1]|uniref:rhamnogalacturonan acetylesterase n=1 Tax=Massilia sp. S19_KUP03_FR1 TaxID=3025503 RepID=UPI002FCD90D6
MNHCLTCLFIALSLLGAHATGAEPALPIRVILVGDSTMATRSGYGDALCALFTSETTCINLARGGRSSGSFRAEGRWDEVQALLKDSAAYRASYVLVQFGHNDQPGKAGRSTDLVTQFPSNMARYASEVQQLGGVPVLVTPLTRRSFRGPYLKDDLAPWADATRTVARALKVSLLDLHALSAASVQQMGQQEADTLAMAPPPQAAVAATPTVNGALGEPQGTPKTTFDRTHLGPKGASLFAAMVARELARGNPALAPSLK